MQTEKRISAGMQVDTNTETYSKGQAIPILSDPPTQSAISAAVMEDSSNPVGRGGLFWRVLGWFEGHVSPAVFAATSVCLLAIFALFVPPYIGMADNGDYFRMLYSNGLYFSLPDYDSYYLGYFVREFGVMQFFNENGATITSSQSLFIRLSLWINSLFHDQVFDVRVQAGVFVLLYGAAVYLLVEALTWKINRRRGYCIAVLATFVLGDSAYTAFFNSFYSESIVFLMLIFLLASGLLIYRNRYNDYVMLGLFVLSSLLLTTSKQQNAPLGVIIGIVMLPLFFVRRQRAFRACVAASLLGVTLAGAATYLLIPKEFVNINQYHAMTRGILMQSDNPEEDLERWGIDKQYALLAETIYYEPYTTIDVNSKQLEEQFYSKYGFVKVLSYYITHPKQAFQMLDKAATNAFTIRPPAMGNYEKSVGKEYGAQTSFFAGYSIIKHKLAPKTFGFVMLWVVLVGGLYAPSIIKEVKNRSARGLMRGTLLLLLLLLGLSAMLVSIIGAGDADLSKHEFVFTVIFDLVTLTLVADAMSGSLFGKKQPATQAA